MGKLLPEFWAGHKDSEGEKESTRSKSNRPSHVAAMLCSVSGRAWPS